jgi:hypothetical protein
MGNHLLTELTMTYTHDKTEQRERERERERAKKLLDLIILNIG